MKRCFKGRITQIVLLEKCAPQAKIELETHDRLFIDTPAIQVPEGMVLLGAEVRITIETIDAFGCTEDERK